MLERVSTILGASPREMKSVASNRYYGGTTRHIGAGYWGRRARPVADQSQHPPIRESQASQVESPARDNPARFTAWRNQWRRRPPARSTPTCSDPRGTQGGLSPPQGRIQPETTGTTERPQHQSRAGFRALVRSGTHLPARVSAPSRRRPQQHRTAPRPTWSGGGRRSAACRLNYRGVFKNRGVLKPRA